MLEEKWGGGRTVCCVHYVVEVVDCYTAIFPCFAGYATEPVFAFAAGFVSAFSGEETRWDSVLAG